MMILGAVVGAAIAGPFGGFAKHEKLSMNSWVLFSAIAALLGILAWIGTRYRWIRESGRLMLYIIAPILLAVHLNYSWASSGPVHRLDASIVTGRFHRWQLQLHSGNSHAGLAVVKQRDWTQQTTLHNPRF
jgi:hypothetical protein